jgi:transcriptional regulator with XRE-family HTH domain
MKIMISIDESISALKDLGERLRERRIERQQTQRLFAQRIGVSVPTLRAMEEGRPTVAVGHWADALWAIGNLDDLKQLLQPPQSLFARAQIEEAARKRVRRRVRTPR